MSEHKPDKERKIQPLTDNCDNCEQTYPLTSYNANVYHHAEQPECDYIICACPNCDYRTRIFISEHTFEDAIKLNLPLTVEKFAPDDVHTSWLKAHGREIPAEHELNPRHEDLIRKFGDSLLHMPDDLLGDGFSSESLRPYPERWI